MGMLAEIGVMHLWNGEKYVGAKSKYQTIEDFVEEAVTNYDILYDLGFTKQEVIDMICPHVITGYMAHRACPCPEDDMWDGDWWEYLSTPGKGRSPVWCFDLDNLKDPATNRFPTKCIGEIK